MVRWNCETQRAAFVGRFLAWSNDAAAAGAWTWMWWRAKTKLPLPARGGETIQCKQWYSQRQLPVKKIAREGYFTVIKSIGQGERKI